MNNDIIGTYRKLFNFSVYLEHISQGETFWTIGFCLLSLNLTRNVNQFGLKKVATSFLQAMLSILNLKLMLERGWYLVGMTGFQEPCCLREKGFCKGWEVLRSLVAGWFSCLKLYTTSNPNI